MKEAIAALGSEGELKIRILRSGDNRLDVTLQHKGVDVFQIPTCEIGVGDEIVLEQLKIGMDLNWTF